MSNHEEEQIVRGYDPVIMKRLLGFLVPYIRPAIVAVTAMLIATGAELLLPIVLQRAIDRHIVVRYHLCRTDGRVPFPSEYQDESSPQIGDSIFITGEQLKKIPGNTKVELREAGVISDETWYVFSIADGSEELPGLINANKDLFLVDDRYGGIRTDDLQQLTREERRVLRAADIRGVTRASYLYLLLLVLILVFSFFQVYLMTLVGQKIMRDMRLKLFSHTIRQSLSFLNRTPVGSLVTRITNDVETLSELFSTVATAFFKDVAVLIGVVAVLFLLNARLAVVALLTTPPTLLSIWFFRIKGREAYRKVRLWVSQVNTFLSEHISGIEVVKMLGREARSMKEFHRRNEGLLGANLSEVRIMAIFRPMVSLFTSVSVGIVIYAGAGMRLRDAVSLGVLIAFINLVEKFYRPIQDISEKFTLLQSALAGGERIFNLMDSNIVIEDTPTPATIPRIQGRIDFEHVTFGYNPDEPVLKDVSFSVMPGETVALVGYTGAGKTTLFNLFVRFWDTQEGSIKIDGVDIRNLSLAELRRTVQPVQQDVFLFSGSIEENLKLGRDIDDDAIKTAAKAVKADGFIGSLNHGYATELQEGGANLSSGQRQLLSFARTVAGDPKIVILDEATSSIDTETERLVQSALARLLEGRTSLAIAHRLSTIRHADRIVVLSHGQVAEIGSHDELMAAEGLYHSLYLLQYDPHSDT